MSWWNVLRRTSLDFCPTGNFPRTFTHFDFIISTQVIISTYVDLRPQNLQLSVVFQMSLLMCLVIIKKGL